MVLYIMCVYIYIFKYICLNNLVGLIYTYFNCNLLKMCSFINKKIDLSKHINAEISEVLPILIFHRIGT